MLAFLLVERGAGMDQNGDVFSLGLSAELLDDLNPAAIGHCKV